MSSTMPHHTNSYVNDKESTNFGFDDDSKVDQGVYEMVEHKIPIEKKLENAANSNDTYFTQFTTKSDFLEPKPSSGSYIDVVYADDSTDTRTSESTHGSDSLGSGIAGTLEGMQKKMATFLHKNVSVIKTSVLVALVMGYAAYFAYALYYEFGDEPSIRLLWVTMTVVACFIISLVRNQWGDVIYERLMKPVVAFIMKHWRLFKWSFISLVIAGYITFLIVEVALRQPYNLVSFGGMVVYLLLMFFYSIDRWRIDWQPVLWGLGLQFVFALLVLRTKFGYEAFSWLGDRVQEFMAYSDQGAIFIFGEKYTDHFFAMKVLPVIIFFSSVISVLYYLGAMQFAIQKISWVMQKTLGTSAGESVNAAGNIFIGMTEAPLLIRPLIGKMSTSEIHAVMVGGFATIAGSVMATYILIGVPANHLLSASIMAAPCALGLSKMVYPETREAKEAQKKAGDGPGMEASADKNLMEAAASGAIAAIALCANIAANLMAFISLLAFINATLGWFGDRVGLTDPQLSFEFICSYVLWPFAFLIGAASEDCRKVAELLGTKLFLNEFVAYTALSKIIENKAEFDKYTLNYGGNWTKVNNDVFLPLTNTTLIGGIMQERSIVISTYALCGFANVASIGIVIGSLSGILPEKKSLYAQLAPRAMIVGNVVSLMNACTAGLLYRE